MKNAPVTSTERVMPTVTYVYEVGSVVAFAKKSGVSMGKVEEVHITVTRGQVEVSYHLVVPNPVRESTVRKYQRQIEAPVLNHNEVVPARCVCDTLEQAWLIYSNGEI